MIMDCMSVFGGTRCTRLHRSVGTSHTLRVPRRRNKHRSQSCLPKHKQKKQNYEVMCSGRWRFGYHFLSSQTYRMFFYSAPAPHLVTCTLYREQHEKHQLHEFVVPKWPRAALLLESPIQTTEPLPEPSRKYTN